jgi:hypothetical protein
VVKRDLADASIAALSADGRFATARQIDEYGIVVWYDAEQRYEPILASLQRPDTTIERFDRENMRTPANSSIVNGMICTA